MKGSIMYNLMKGAFRGEIHKIWYVINVCKRRK